MNPQPKTKTFRSKKAVELFRQLPCFICNMSGVKGYQVTGHHEPLRGRGTGLKGPDDEQIPLCFDHHKERHDKGRDTFYWWHNIKNWRTIVKAYKFTVEMHLKRKKRVL